MEDIDNYSPPSSDDEGLRDMDIYSPAKSALKRIRTEPDALKRSDVNKAFNDHVARGWKCREGQFEVIKAIRLGNDVTCSFPTASGKTAIMMGNVLLDAVYGREGAWVLVQPLEALRNTTAAKIQLEYFADTSVNVLLWHGGNDLEFVDWEECVTLILCSPEQLTSVLLSIKRMEKKSLVRGLMVDEVHLRRLWDFRDYTETDTFTSEFGHACVALFSATMDEALELWLIERMALRNTVCFNCLTFPGLVEMKLRRWDQFVFTKCSMELDIVESHVIAMYEQIGAGKSIIIFCPSYTLLGRLTDLLLRPKMLPHKPRMYCSIFDSDHKTKTCDLLNSSSCELVGASIALGTGVDLSNIGGIVLFGCPKSFSEAEQEIGRAGRGTDDEVPVIVASDATVNKEVENSMRLFMGYCSAARDPKKKIECPCGEKIALPKLIGANETYVTCFDIESVHCGRPTRPVCRRMLCKFLAKLVKESDLINAALDCGVCWACKGVVDLPIQVKSLVLYKKEQCVVVQIVAGSRPLRIISLDGVPHTVAIKSVAFVAQNHTIPAEIEWNKLNAWQREWYCLVLRDSFEEAAGVSCVLVSSVPSLKMIHLLSRLKPVDAARRCPMSWQLIATTAWFESHFHGVPKQNPADMGDKGEPELVSESLRFFVSSNEKLLEMSMKDFEARQAAAIQSRKSKSSATKRSAASLGGVASLPIGERPQTRSKSMGGVK